MSLETKVAVNVAAVLAAGSASRFGSAKQVATLDGETLARRAVRVSLEAGFAPVVIVVGANAEATMAVVSDLGPRVVHNPRWRDGIGSSVSAAAEAAEVLVAESLCIVLADQPLIDAAHLRALVERRAETESSIAATDYGSRLGVPAVFSREHFERLRELRGDRGASSVIANAVAVCGIPNDVASFDVDTPDDLARAALLIGRKR